MPYKIRLRRDVSSDWILANTYLDDGEAGYDTTNNKIKIGPGYWNDLSYLEANITNELLAGSNITIVENTNGSLTISSTGGSGSPGGDDTQVQYNNNNSFDASSNFTFNYTTNQLGLNGNFYLNGSIVDVNSNEQLKFGSVGSAVNEITITNAAASNSPKIAASGGDTNISLYLAGKGTGYPIIDDNKLGTTNSAFDLINETATTLNVGGAAIAITMGATSGTTTNIRGGTLVGNTTTQNVFNTTATTLNVGGAATTLSLGASSGNITLKNPYLTLGTSAATIATASSGSTNHLNIKPYGQLVLEPVPASLGGGEACSIIIDNTIGSSINFIGDLYIGARDTDGNENYVQSNIIFEGSVRDGNETTLTVENPTADRTITLPDATGTVALVSGSTTQVMFNDGGSALGGDAGFTYDKTTDTLSLGTSTTSGVLVVKDQGQIKFEEDSTNGTNFIAIKSAYSLTSDSTYILPASIGSSNQVLQIASIDGSNATLQWGTVSGGSAPGGSDTQVQFNDGGSTLGGDAGFTYDKTTDTLSLGTSTTPGTLTIKDQGQVKFEENNSNGTNYVSLKASTNLVSDATYVLPSSIGTANQVLSISSINGSEASLIWAAGGTKTYAVFTPLDNYPPASNFATLDTRNTTSPILVLDFDAGTDESAIFHSIMPEAASLGSGLKIQINWMATTATSGTCRWRAEIERMNTDEDTDDWDSPAATAGTLTNATSGIITTTVITITAIDSVAAGEPYRLRITRDADGTSGTDDMSGDAELVSVEVRSAS